MRHAIALMLETDTIDWLDVVAKNLSRQRKTDVSRSEAIEYIILRHWMKIQKRTAEKRSNIKHPFALDKR